MKYLFDGKSYASIDSLQTDPRYQKVGEPIMVTGPGLPKRNVTYVLKSDSELRRWSRETRLADMVSRMLKEVAAARKLENEDHSALKKRQQTVARRIKSDLQELSRATGLEVGSKELLKRATIERNVLEGSIFDPAVLFTNTGFGGSFLGVGLPLPNLGWFPGFNNTVSSVTVVGLCVLWAGTWFRGAALVLPGLPVAGYATLPGFNNVASSVWVGYP